MIMNFSHIMFTIGLLKLLKSSSMILSMISLEMITGSLLMMVLMNFYSVSSSSMPITFIVISVIEGIMGLTMVVSCSRMKGNDYIKSNSMSKL